MTLNFSDAAENGIAMESETPMTIEQESVPAIYLTTNNCTPSAGQEVTVYVYSESSIFVMDIWANVTGNADLTSAMSIADCNEYGWDAGWQMDSYFDDEGWVYFGGVAWPDETAGNVGYFKFIYQSGQVTISILEEFSSAFDSECQAVRFSTEPLIVGQ